MQCFIPTSRRLKIGGLINLPLRWTRCRRWPLWWAFHSTDSTRTSMTWSSSRFDHGYLRHFAGSSGTKCFNPIFACCIRWFWCSSLRRSAMNSKARHKFTPKVVRDILASDRFQSRCELWQIIRNHEDASIQWRWPYPVLYASTLQLQYSGALPNTFPSGNRCFHSMVQRQECTSCLSPTSSLGIESWFGETTATVSSKMASSSSIPSSSLPLPFV